MNIRQLVSDDTDEDGGVRLKRKKNTGDVFLLQTGRFFMNINQPNGLIKAGWRITTGNLLFADNWWRLLLVTFFGDILLLVTFCDWWRFVTGDVSWLGTFCD